VEGYVAAAVDMVKLRAEPGQTLLAAKHVVLLAALAQSVHGRMLDQQYGAGFACGLHARGFGSAQRIEQ
jgi:hypothetical protein